MEMSFTLTRGGDGSEGEQPLTFSFLGPAVQAALRRGLQGAAQRAASQTQRQGSGQAAGAPAGAHHVLHVEDLGSLPLLPGGMSGTSLPPHLELVRMIAQQRAREAAGAAPAAAAAAATGTPAAAPAAAAAEAGTPAAAALASGTASTAGGSGIQQPDLGRMIERIHRLSGAVAGSIFQDLIAGTIRTGETGAPPASEKAIEALDRSAPAPPGSQCTVCLMDLSEEERVTRMPCGHCFHDGCLVQWLRSHNTCPTCRHAIEPTEAPRPTPLSAVLQSWHERMRAEQAAQAAAAPEAAPAEAAPARTAASTRGSRRSSGGSGSTSHDPHRHPQQGSGPDASAATSAGAGSSSEGSEGGEGSEVDGGSGSGTTPPETEAQLQRLSIGELKRRLTELHVDFSGAVEKHELLTLLRRHMQPPPAAAPRQRNNQLHVQVHMEVVQVPIGELPAELQGNGGAAGPLAALQAAAAAAMASAARSGAFGPAPAAAPAVAMVADTSLADVATHDAASPSAQETDAPASAGRRMLRSNGGGGGGGSGSASAAASPASSSSPSSSTRELRKRKRD